MSPDYEQLYLESDLDNGLPVGLTAAIAKQETGHIRDEATRNRVRSPKGAIGHMQFMPATGQQYGLRSESDLMDPVKAIPAAGRYLGDLYHQFGRPDLTAAAYNAGPGAVKKHGGVPPYPQTQGYVANINGHMGQAQRPDDLLRVMNGSLVGSTQNAMRRGVGYKLGARDSATGAVDCSGWVGEINKGMMQDTNRQAGRPVYGENAMKAMEGTSESIIDNVSKATGRLLTNADLTDPAQIQEGMLFGMDTGQHGWEGQRQRGIDHIVQAVRDPRTGRMMISQSNSGRGPNMQTPAAEWLANNQRRGHRLYGVDPTLMAQEPLRLASVQHAHGMMRKYSPSFAEQGMNFFIPPAYGADQPQGPGVMTDWKAAGEELDQIINEGTQQPGATDWDAAGAELEQIIGEGAPQPGMSPTLQAAVRVGSRVLTNPADLMSDALMAGPKAVAWGVNKLRPGTIDVPSVSGMVSKGLTAAGINPEAQSPEERALTAGLTAATTAPLMGASSLGSIAAQGLGAAASSASVDMAQQAGAGLPGQLAAGVVGGMVPSVGMSAMRGVGNTINRGTAPFRPGGKEAIAGRLLNKQASAPQTVLNRVDDPNINRAIIPGSAPTLAEVSQDPGISQLQRGMGRIGLDAGVDQINAVRVSQLDNLIHETLDRVNKHRGGRDTVEAVRAVKHRIGAEFEQGLAARGIDTMALPVAPQTLSDRIKELARKHEGNDALTGLIAKVSTQLGDEAPSFNKLWNMRQSLDDSIYEKWATASSASKGDMKRVGEQLRSAMNADLVAAVPEFQPFLSRYARMSRAEGRLKLGRKLKEGVQNMGSGIAGEGQLYGERTISLDQLQKIDFDKAQQRAGATLAPYQREAFDAATAEKRRANFMFSGGQAPRSDTAQNLALDQVISDDIIGGLLGDNSGQTGLVGILRGLGQNTLGAPLTALTKAAKNDILRLVAKGLIDPQEGARLMRLGTLKQSESFAKKLQGGAETGVLSSIYSNMVR